MSALTRESRLSVSASTSDCLPRVKPDLSSVCEAIASRAAKLPRRNERIHIDFSQGEVLVIDLETGTTSSDSSGGVPIVTLSVEPHTMARILNGTKEPRSLLLFDILQFEGLIESGIRLCDELAGNRFPLQAIFTDLPLPSPTTDRELARRQIEAFGYCILKDALTMDEVEGLRTRLDEQAAAEMSSGVGYFEGGRGSGEERRGYRGDIAPVEASAATVAPNQRVWLLHNKGDEFVRLLENSVASEFVPDCLDEDYPLLGQYSANIVGPGSEAQFLHQDQHPVQPATQFSIAVNTLFCLDDFTEENGGTRIVPGSHIMQRGLAPDNIYSSQGTVAALATAGSAIVIESRLWHGAGINTTNSRRRAIIMLTQRSWTRTVNNGILGVHPTVLAKMSDQVKSLFGFRVTGGLGSIQTESEASFVNWDPDQLVLKLGPRAGA